MTVQVTGDVDFSGQGVIEADSVDIGFISAARYPDGTRVLDVAARNEFGDRRVPERPFMRIALESLAQGLLRDIADEVERGERVSFSREDAAKIGAIGVNEIQETITQLDEPPNAPETIRRKGSSNPLIDTGFMRRSVTYRVNAS